MKLEIQYTGCCWSCNDRRFKRTLEGVAGAENVLDVIQWFREVNAQLEKQGWKFLTTEDGKVRAYCGPCWDRTEG